ncbi:hypothetical protein, partial [Clavibacter michiganensis]|uniref:hypothetical protein n=1 Tax=Clavibacter michiganensis TaxID=28447 RepID=UPI0029312129
FKGAPNSYLVGLSPIPSGSCNQATLFGTDPNSTAAIYKSQYTAALNLAQSLSGCTNTVAAIQNQINSVPTYSQSNWNAAVAQYQWTPIASLVVEGNATIPKLWPSLTAAQTAAVTAGSVSQYQTYSYESMVQTYASAAS